MITRRVRGSHIAFDGNWAVGDDPGRPGKHVALLYSKSSDSFQIVRGDLAETLMMAAPDMWDEGAISRFVSALQLLCTAVPTRTQVLCWLRGIDEDLQEWVANHLRLPWTMGITVLEAAELLAREPADDAEG